MSPSAAAPASKSYSIASIPADGIGPEVIDAAIAVLKTLSETLGTFELDFTHFDWSSETYKRTGKYIPAGGLEELKKHDAILFGAVGAPGEHYIKLLHHLFRGTRLIKGNRRTRSYLALGIASGHLPDFPAVRQCSPHQGFPWNSVSSPQLQDWRPGLGDCP